MELCDGCTKRIQDILNRGTGGHVQDELPRYPQLCKRLCWMCKRFISWVQPTHPILFKKWRGSPLTVIFKLSSWATMEDGPRNPGHLLPCEIEVIPLFRGEVANDYGCVIGLDFMSEEDVSRWISTASRHRPVPLDLDLIRKWIDNCTRNHRRCANHLSQPWYPTRLLHVASGRLLTGIRLVITKGTPIKGPYMTLSHRWAPHAHRFPMLRSSTISQFQRGINVQRLPQVFQDAIDLTRQLGVDYLWIDSLCIIQDEDDHSDWDRECLTMDKVYSHAFLNISATLSQSGTESLFHPRHSQAPSLPPRIDINAHGNMKQYVLDSNFWHNEISDGPLNSRGWVFQERFLACRVLHFGQRQIGWECQVSEAIEAFPDGLPPSLTVGSRSKPGNHEALREASQTILSQAQIVQNELLMSSPAADIRFAEWWNCLIEDYSRCKFTFTKDKLIALSGVAKCVAKSRPADRYLAGMWQSCMVYGLAWFRIHDPERVYSNTGSFEFPSPSWSWASFDGEVCFPPIGPGNPECFAKVVRIAEDPMLLEGAVYANANISPHAYSSIKIESFLFPLHVHWSEKSIDNVMLVDFGLCFSVNDELFGAGIDLEEDEMLKSMTCRDPLFLVPLYATIYFLQAMILVGAEGQGNVYRRLGMIEIPIQMQDAKNEEADQIRLNWNALHLKQHMKKHEKGVEKNSRYSAFEIL